MSPSVRRAALGALLVTSGLALGAAAGRALPKTYEPTGCVIEHSVHVDAAPEAAWDAFTGDILPWWDHHMSKEPKALELQARPGGHFLETFDDEGNGAVHATVTYVDAPRELHFTGRLGFATTNTHLAMTHRVRFEPEGEGTRVTIDVHALGETAAESEPVLQAVWQHFLEARYEAYVEGRLK